VSVGDVTLPTSTTEDHCPRCGLEIVVTSIIGDDGVSRYRCRTSWVWKFTSSRTLHRIAPEDLEPWRAEPEIPAASPHCDPDVLHRPSKCEFCDQFPSRQAARVRDRVNFTGEEDQAKGPCPSTITRPLEVIERWSGNRPHPPEPELPLVTGCGLPYHAHDCDCGT